jgi:cysteinyl-tRNA synthetase
MNIYNSLTSGIELFSPINSDEVGIYTCGPTVYDDVHIGNLSSFIYADSLARVLRLDYRVKHVMNITDVDDKTIRRSQKHYPTLDPKQALSKLTKEYEDKFKADIAKLNIDPNKYTFIRATQSIDLMQELINKLLETGFAYLADDGIYFSISKYRSSGKKYGKLIKLDLTDTDSSQSRIDNDEYDKQTIHDFALWKFKKDNEPAWSYIINGQDYPGRPGWHIECSAMSTSLLGQPFDLHTGGVDLKFPHHENEIAQSTSDDSSEYLAKTFFHNEHLLNDSQKMSKSLNNFLTLDDISKQIDDLVAFRLLVLQSNYKNRADFSIDNLKAANTRLLSYKNFAALKYQLDETNKSGKFNFKRIQDQIISAMNDDLNSPKALAELSMFINTIENSLINYDQAKDLDNFLKLVDELFGFGLDQIDDITMSQKTKLISRFTKRQNKDWQGSDLIRDDLLKAGIGIIDTDKYQIWFRV